MKLINCFYAKIAQSNKKVNVVRRAQQNNKSSDAQREAISSLVQGLSTIIAKPKRRAVESARTKNPRKQKMPEYKRVDVTGSPLEDVNILPATAAFGKVYADPFLVGPASLPITPLLSHQNIRVKAGGTFTTNANGNGWICVVPDNLIYNDAGNICIVASQTGSSDAMSPNVTGSPNISFGTNSPYTYADFAVEEEDKKVYRTVAVGLRIRYLGTTLNAAGTCYTLELEPRTVDSTLNAMTLNDIKNMPNWKEYTFRDKSWHAVTRHLQSRVDYLYKANAEGIGPVFPELGQTQTTPEKNFTMGIYISAQPNQKVEFELVAHFEVAGPNLPTRRVVIADEHVADKIVSAYKQKRYQDNTTKDHSVEKPVESKGGFLDTLAGIAQVAIPLIPKFLAML